MTGVRVGFGLGAEDDRQGETRARSKIVFLHNMCRVVHIACCSWCWFCLANEEGCSGWSHRGQVGGAQDARCAWQCGVWRVGLGKASVRLES